MSAAQLLELAQAEGIQLVLEDGRLTWEADHEPPGELLQEIRTHRLEIIKALHEASDSPPQAMEWLEKLAGLLGCSPDYLLVHGFVDRHDLTEQHQHPPRFAARLIRSHPQWRAPAGFSEQYTREDGHEPYEPQNADEVISPAWIAARDAYHAHAFGACPRCYPPLKRHCLIGAELRARYDHEPHILEARDGKSRA